MYALIQLKLQSLVGVELLFFNDGNDTLLEY